MRMVRMGGKDSILVSTSASHFFWHLSVIPLRLAHEEQKYCSLPAIRSFVNSTCSASSSRGMFTTQQS